jgi:hypothetical protein
LQLIVSKKQNRKNTPSTVPCRKTGNALPWIAQATITLSTGPPAIQKWENGIRIGAEQENEGTEKSPEDAYLPGCRISPRLCR